MGHRTSRVALDTNGNAPTGCRQKCGRVIIDLGNMIQWAVLRQTSVKGLPFFLMRALHRWLNGGEGQGGGEGGTGGSRGGGGREGRGGGQP